MVRVHMVGGTSFEVDADQVTAVKEVLRFEDQGEKWIGFYDRNDNRHDVRVEHIVHIQEVQW